jgi:hypothetical protein
VIGELKVQTFLHRTIAYKHKRVVVASKTINCLGDVAFGGAYDSSPPNQRSELRRKVDAGGQPWRKHDAPRRAPRSRTIEDRAEITTDREDYILVSSAWALGDAQQLLQQLLLAVERWAGERRAHLLPKYLWKRPTWTDRQPCSDQFCEQRHRRCCGVQKEKKQLG